jgi:hypothetical protein
VFEATVGVTQFKNPVFEATVGVTQFKLEADE